MQIIVKAGAVISFLNEDPESCEPALVRILEKGKPAREIIVKVCERIHGAGTVYRRKYFEEGKK